jgi:hypothetical protein
MPAREGEPHRHRCNARRRGGRPEAKGYRDDEKPGERQNEITRAVKARCQKENKDPCEVLAEMLEEARKAGDQEKIKKIKQAQKYLGCRNIRKRKRRGS